MIIHKYVIEPTSRYSLSLPFGSEIISVQNQNEKLCAWVRIDDPRELQRRVHNLRIVMTGDEETSHVALLRFLGTVQMAKGALVLHIFEEMF